MTEVAPESSRIVVNTGRPGKKNLAHNRALTLRIDEVPVDKPHEVLQQELESTINQVPELKQGVTLTVHHHLVRRDQNFACATATFYTSIPVSDLVKELAQASAQHQHSYSFDAHFGGVTPVYESTGGAHVDVIAVPGLASHAIGSWRSPSSNDVWLRDYLKDDIHGIRVLVYGFDTSLLSSNAKDTVEDLGKRFFESINVFRRDTQTDRRPIIFIGHSLGGLLIKEALVYANKKSADLQRLNLRKACYGLLFFGVPNLGLRHEQLLNIVQGKPTELLVRDLVVDNDSDPSPFLKRISTEFSECCKGRYKVVSFFERKYSPTVQIQPDGTLAKTGSMMLLVTEKSATGTGLTATADESNISLPLDHSGLVKFERRGQQEYKIVKEKLKTLVAEARAEAGKRFRDNRSYKSNSPLIRDCLQSLAFTEMDDRRNDVDNPVKGTCQWLLQHEKYREWVGNRGLLWISGKPGSGKSTLLKYVLQKFEAKPTKDMVIISFFFHGRGSELQRSPLGLFRALLHQLFKHAPDCLRNLVDRFKHLRETVGPQSKKWRWHPKELEGFVRSSLANMLVGNLAVILFVDALDECGEQNAADLVKFFKSLPMATSKLGICFSCRHYPILPLDPRLSICVEHENEHDIETYVHAQLSTLGTPSASTVATTVTALASGIFMWARLVVVGVEQSQRNGATQGEIEADIQRTPRDMGHLYHTLVQGMKDKVKSLKLIRWICFATRPLTVDELQWAMVIDADCGYKSLQQCRGAQGYTGDREVMERRIKYFSCGLAEVIPESNVVQFIHGSVKEFFLDKGLFVLDSSMNSPDLAVGTAHYHLSRVCIRYLAMEEIASWTSCDRDNLTSQFPLLHYVATSWAAHAEQSEAAKVSQRDLLEYFDWPSNALVELWVRACRILNEDAGWVTEGTTLVHVMSRHQLQGLLRDSLQLVRFSKDIDTKDSLGRTPLSLAAEKGHETTVKLLLDTGQVEIDSRDNHGLAPLSWAARHGHEAVVRLLLEREATTTVENNHGWMPVHLASDRGHIEVVKLLYQKGANAKAISNKGWTPLHAASRGGHINLVQLLLEQGADAMATTNNGITPLHWASQEGHIEVIKLLVENGADVVAANHAEVTPQLLALLNDQSEVVELLLEQGADIMAATDNGVMPLHWASQEGHTEVVKLLLENGADVMTRTTLGVTPLHWASQEGHTEVVELLLENGADVKAITNNGWTPLHMASQNGHVEVIKLLRVDEVDPSEEVNS